MVKIVEFLNVAIDAMFENFELDDHLECLLISEPRSVQFKVIESLDCHIAEGISPVRGDFGPLDPEVLRPQPVETGVPVHQHFIEGHRRRHQPLGHPPHHADKQVLVHVLCVQPVQFSEHLHDV